ncbi:DUF2752 domain-containing protein [Hydrogenoanaerobacterium sp.]|uniref:DUF2752 domain-containing protein n=1 Tax=Hydrogenoanaerobacterium sp. TaxID=2953763 RepID=UPI0028A0C974|nr:DUF2752 domain-containing protein [Hydrogenoanaerobacterium sp.]
MWLYFSNPRGAGIPCPVRTLTGFYCAGCGASRALRSVLHLQFYRAFRFNPALIILLPFIVLYIAARMVDYVKTGQNNIDRRLSFRVLWWVLMLLLVYSVVRNIPVYPFTLLVPTIV